MAKSSQRSHSPLFFAGCFAIGLSVLVVSASAVSRETWGLRQSVETMNAQGRMVSVSPLEFKPHSIIEWRKLETAEREHIGAMIEKQLGQIQELRTRGSGFKVTPESLDPQSGELKAAQVFSFAQSRIERILTFAKKFESSLESKDKTTVRQLQYLARMIRSLENLHQTRALILETDTRLSEAGREMALWLATKPSPLREQSLREIGDSLSTLPIDRFFESERQRLEAESVSFQFFFPDHIGIQVREQQAFALALRHDLTRTTSAALDLQDRRSILLRRLAANIQNGHVYSFAASRIENENRDQREQLLTPVTRSPVSSRESASTAVHGVKLASLTLSRQISLDNSIPRRRK